jgi:molybdate transport system substrate-binding protein
MLVKCKRLWIGLFCSLLLFFSFNLSACELYWYLGASMSKPGKEAVEKYNQQTKTCRVLLAIGGSGQLLSQLQMAKKGDLYTPASEAFLNKAKELGVVAGHRLLLEQRPVFGLSSEGAGKIKNFTDLMNPGNRIALGNPKTMALGKTYLGIEAKMDEGTRKGIRKNVLLLAININQVVNYLLTNTVDAGITFDTTATANGLPYIQIPEELSRTNRAFLVKLIFSEHPEEVERFQNFLFKQQAIFKKYGFDLNSQNL